MTAFQHLIARAPFLQRACKQSTLASGDNELDPAVCDETLNELKKGIAVWTSGQVRFVDKVPSVHLG